MEVTIERVASFNLRNLLGHDASEAALRAHEGCIQRSSVIWLGRADGIEACAVGLIPATVFAEEPYLWMIHTRICEQHPLRFMRWSRRVMSEILDLYPSVIGLCRCDNLAGRRWLEWLGATFDGTGTPNHQGFRISRWPHP